MLKVPRTSVGGLMAFTAILAVDLAAFASLGERRLSSWDQELVYGIVPVINALALGLFLIARQLVRRGESGAFLVGFEAFGWLATGAFLVLRIIDDGWIWRYEWYVSERLTDFWFKYIMWTGEFTRTHLMELRASFRVIALVMPLLAVAVLGGCLARSFGVVLIRREMAQDRPRAIPVRTALIAATVAGMIFLVPALWAAKYSQKQMLLQHWARRAAFSVRAHRATYASALAQEQSFRERLRDDRLSASEVSALEQNAESAKAEAERARRELERYEGWETIYRRAARYPWRESPPFPPPARDGL